MAGIFYWVVFPTSGTAPANSQAGADYIVAGQDGAGVAAAASGQESDDGSSTTIDEATLISSLSPNTSYKVAWTWKDGSTYTTSPYVVVSDSITTAPPFNVGWACQANSIIRSGASYAA